jgi:hypothetical protein
MDDDPDDDLTEIQAATSPVELHRLLLRGRVDGRSTGQRRWTPGAARPFLPAPSTRRTHCPTPTCGPRSRAA